METAAVRILVISSHAQALVRSVHALRTDLPEAEVRAAATLEQGRGEVAASQPEVVFVLAQDGLLEASLAFCRWLRAKPSGDRVSLVLVYPSMDVHDWKRLYEAQGDMFIAWDGDFVDGLASCVRSLLGRRYHIVGTPLKAGALHLFPAGMMARLGGRMVSFTPAEFRILRHLVENADRVVPLDELAAVLVAEPGARRSPRQLKARVYQHMLQIRKKLGLHADVIRTVRGAGYCIDVTYQPDAG